jgi:hypothetical protein
MKFLILLVFLLVVAGCGGGSSSSEPVAPSPLTPVSQSPTVQFTTEVSDINSGESFQLSWSSTDADSCAASGSWQGSQPASGSIEVETFGSGSRLYTLNCSGNGGTTEATFNINVLLTEEQLNSQVAASAAITVL